MWVRQEDPDQHSHPKKKKKKKKKTSIRNLVPTRVKAKRSGELMLAMFRSRPPRRWRTRVATSPSARAVRRSLRRFRMWSASKRPSPTDSSSGAGEAGR